MKIFFWNVRGVGNLPTRREVRQFTNKYRSDIIGLAEPMVIFDKVLRQFWLSFGFVLFTTIKRNCLDLNI